MSFFNSISKSSAMVEKSSKVVEKSSRVIEDSTDAFLAASNASKVPTPKYIADACAKGSKAVTTTSEMANASSEFSKK